MGNILSINIQGTEKNYNANLPNYTLTHCDKQDLDYLFNAISISDRSKIGSFYDNIKHSKDLEILWHSFCYKHKLIINKIRFESFQILYHNKFNIKYEIGFNALWNIANNQKIPIQVFKKEKSNSSSSKHEYHHIHSSWYIYIGIKTLKQRKMDTIQHINTAYNLVENTNDEPINDEIMNILCSYLPTNHILNYSQRRTFKLCKFTLSHQNDQEIQENDDKHYLFLNDINNLVSQKSEFMKLFEINTIKLLMLDYDIKSHEILQFTRYLLLFFHHFYVSKWIKSKCNYHSKQGKFMNNALSEVMKIWSRQNTQNRNNDQCKQDLNVNRIRVK